MEFTAEHQTFIVNSYLRTVRFIGSYNVQYDVHVCEDDFLLAYSQFQQISRRNIMRRLRRLVVSYTKDLLDLVYFKISLLL